MPAAPTTVAQRPCCSSLCHCSASLQVIHTPITTVWIVSVIAKVRAADVKILLCCRASDAPRKQITDAPRKNAQMRPIAVSRLKTCIVTVLMLILFWPIERATTPEAHMMIATVAVKLRLSFNSSAPSRATITTSSFENVVPTAKVLNENIHSNNTVNSICATLPATQNTKNSVFKSGRESPVL